MSGRVPTDPDAPDPASGPDVGRAVPRRPLRGHGATSTRSIDFDRQILRPGHRRARGRTPRCWPTGALISAGRTPPLIAQRPRHGWSSEIEEGRFAFSRSAGGHPHERRIAAGGAYRRRGRDGCTPRARATTRWRPTSGCGSAATPSTGMDEGLAALQAALIDRAEAERRHRHARLHPSAGGAAGDLRPPPDGLCRDGRARPGPLRRLPGAAQRMPARRGGAGRHLLPDRPRPRPPPALGFDRPAAEFARRGVGPGLRAGVPRGRRRSAVIHLSRFSPRRSSTGPARSSASSALSDAFTTGSSIMPQKRNPDAAELVRGKAGRIVGALNALLMTMKGLPLAFFKDMQEDKEPLFDAADTLDMCIAACVGMVRDMRANPDAMRRAADLGFATATDLADWLVRTLDMPFRSAHHVTGAVVRLAEDPRLPSRPARHGGAEGHRTAHHARGIQCAGPEPGPSPAGQASAGRRPGMSGRRPRRRGSGFSARDHQRGMSQCHETSGCAG